MYLRSDWFIQELKHLKFRVHIKIVKYIFKWGGVTCDFKSNLRCTLIRFWNHAYDFSPNCTPLSLITIIYYTHFEITVGPCNLINSNWCDLFLNRTIFCFNFHIFLSREEASLKTKQPIRFQGLLKTTDEIAGKWETTSSMRQILQLLFPKLLSFPPKNGWI